VLYIPIEVITEKKCGDCCECKSKEYKVNFCSSCEPKTGVKKFISQLGSVLFFIFAILLFTANDILTGNDLHLIFFLVLAYACAVFSD
jgi:hypothetical protein